MTDAEVPQFILEVPAGVLASVVAAQGQARSDALGDAAEVLPDPLLYGFQCIGNLKAPL